MSFVPVPPSTPVCIALAVLSCLIAPRVVAQQLGVPQGDDAAPASDPGMVIARTVNPRIAYRAIPTDENPIHSRATLFPARAFHGAIDGFTGALVDDTALGARGSAGLRAGAAAETAMRRVFAGESSPLGPGLGTRAANPGTNGVVGGAGALGGTAVGGAVGRAVGGSGLMAGGLFGALPGIIPARQDGGP